MFSGGAAALKGGFKAGKGASDLDRWEQDEADEAAKKDARRAKLAAARADAEAKAAADQLREEEAAAEAEEAAAAADDEDRTLASYEAELEAAIGFRYYCLPLPLSSSPSLLSLLALYLCLPCTNTADVIGF
jgi:hypothetical protein